MRRTASIVCLAVVCALGAGAAAARADEAPSAPPTAAAGVHVGPVDVSGLTLEQATSAVLARWLSPLTLSVAGKKLTVPARRFGIKAPVADAIQQALAAQPGETVPLRALVDMKKVAAYVKRIAARYARKPVAQRLLLQHLKPIVTKGKPGAEVKQFPTRILIRNALRDGSRDTVSVPMRPVKPTLDPVARGPVIVIRRGTNRLTLYRGTHVVRTFKVATGQPRYPTPLGRFHIVVKWKNPTWYPPVNDDWAKGLKPVPPGPNNPLGTRWMGIDSPGVGIHGTDEPASIGYSLSHGCIRMQVPQAEWLFDHVTVGTPVFIVSR
ncbi:MAG TPA: L,D-transpeptidase family protein [Gaiellaceae bacterium]|nr:L,D-transpeptidase family protein [Gaiellaceae bacterium]